MLEKGAMMEMGIQEEIFEEFFKKLNDDDKIPTLIAKELRRLWERNEIVSQEEILAVIEKGCKNDRKNQND